MGKIMMTVTNIKISPIILAAALLMLYSCASRTSKGLNGGKDKKTITIAVTQKPTYPDMITYAILPFLEQKGYAVEQKSVDEARMLVNLLNDGEIDMIIAGHRAAYDFIEKHTGVKVTTLITVPSATEGLFSQTLDAKTVDDLKRQVKKGDAVLMPDDPSNLPRSLIFLEKLGFLKIRESIDKSESSEKDIAENPYGLTFKVMNAAQIPRNLKSVAFAVVFGDDADLLGIMDKAITREVSPSEEYLILFGVKPGRENEQWAKDFKEVVESEEYKNVIEDTKYRFHTYHRPKWYVEKWGIQNKY
jgi:D-methionine transport system substrate-binding protein